ncbi:ArsR family transcriptional regulator [Peptacetobacter hominis]|uniref:ArsR family transcriptional regulator n=1 Tax=Peptacetobacter hominis TaxID=2743610 RepID=A0A544QXA9_9FIRM|nr:metalloregulator ArsR/SmtB family transcription factor [Peptacetobacter hominis]TQQ85339.1 ArsR family transcriptional regulator [Peptacetobacter hominis]
MQEIVKIFKALSDENRVRILVILSQRNICRKGISRHLGISDSAVSQHISVLKSAGLITGVKEGYFVKYRINKDVFNEGKNFLELFLDNNSVEINSLLKDGITELRCYSECKSANRCYKREDLENESLFSSKRG